MKVKFNVNSGANIHSNNESDWLDPVEDLGYDEGDWEDLTDDEKYKEAELWAWQAAGLEIYYEEEP